MHLGRFELCLAPVTVSTAVPSWQPLQWLYATLNNFTRTLPLRDLTLPSQSVSLAAARSSSFSLARAPPSSQPPGNSSVFAPGTQPARSAGGAAEAEYTQEPLTSQLPTTWLWTSPGNALQGHGSRVQPGDCAPISAGHNPWARVNVQTFPREGELRFKSKQLKFSHTSALSHRKGCSRLPVQSTEGEGCSRGLCTASPGLLSTGRSRAVCASRNQALQGQCL